MLANLHCLKQNFVSKPFLAYLVVGAGEVVGALDLAGDALVEVGVATVIGSEDGVLEATGIQKIEVDLAVLAVLSNGDGGAERGDVGIEDQGDGGGIGREELADGALGAAGTTIGDTTDADSARVRSGLSERWLESDADGSSANEGRTEDSEDRESLHYDGLCLEVRVLSRRLKQKAELE